MYSEEKMSFPHSLRKTVFISLIGHITLFSIFSVSFGNRIPTAQYTNVYFWGQLLRSSQVSQGIPVVGSGKKTEFFKKDELLAYAYYLRHVRNTGQMNSNAIPLNWVKPLFTLMLNSEKESFVTKTEKPYFFPERNKPSIIFHPLLPYGFTLYFKDRQVAHVELMFKLESTGPRNSLRIKRKVSSGNLDVDLMTLRYIGHYLFIQPNIAGDNWQTVKIDLSAKDK